MFEALKILIGIVSTASLVAFLFVIFISTFPNQRFRFFRFFKCILDDTQRWDPIYSKSLRAHASEFERWRAYALVTLCVVFLGISVYAGVTQALWWVPRSFGFVDEYDDFTSYVRHFAAILCVVLPGALLEWLLLLIRQSNDWRHYKENHYQFSESTSRINVSNDSNSK